MRRDEGEKERLRALVNGDPLPVPAASNRQTEGSNRQTDAVEAVDPSDPRNEETPPERGVLGARPAGFEPATSCSGGKHSIH